MSVVLPSFPSTSGGVAHLRCLRCGIKVNHSCAAGTTGGASGRGTLRQRVHKLRLGVPSFDASIESSVATPGTSPIEAADTALGQDSVGHRPPVRASIPTSRGPVRSARPDGSLRAPMTATLQVSSPLSSPKAAHSRRTRSDGAPPNPTAEDNLHVLVIDDDAFICDTLSSMLGMCSYSVTVVSDGQQALHLLRTPSQPFDLVLCDVMMPIMDGYEFLTQLRGMEGMDAMPVVMMSGIETRTEVAKCLARGADSYLLKPLVMQEIKVLWQHVISKRKQVMMDQLVGQLWREKAELEDKIRELRSQRGHHANAAVRTTARHRRVVGRQLHRHQLLKEQSKRTKHSAKGRASLLLESVVNPFDLVRSAASVMSRLDGSEYHKRSRSIGIPQVGMGSMVSRLMLDRHLAAAPPAITPCSLNSSDDLHEEIPPLLESAGGATLIPCHTCCCSFMAGDFDRHVTVCALFMSGRTGILQCQQSLLLVGREIDKEIVDLELEMTVSGDELDQRSADVADSGLAPVRGRVVVGVASVVPAPSTPCTEQRLRHSALGALSKCVTAGRLLSLDPASRVPLQQQMAHSSQLGVQLIKIQKQLNEYSNDVHCPCKRRHGLVGSVTAAKVHAATKIMRLKHEHLSTMYLTWAQYGLSQPQPVSTPSSHFNSATSPKAMSSSRASSSKAGRRVTSQTRLHGPAAAGSVPPSHVPVRLRSSDQSILVDPSDFEVVKFVSKGAYGSVFLTRRRSTGAVYAVKAVKNSSATVMDSFLRERDILAFSSCPFIAKLYFSLCTYSDEAATRPENLYLVMEYAGGGDCFSLLQTAGFLQESHARLYIAELVLALQHLHAKGIVHRDLKPDNMVVSADGHIRLVDFGLSRMDLVQLSLSSLFNSSECAQESVHPLARDNFKTQFAEPKDRDTFGLYSQSWRRFSHAGTADYIPPEVLLRGAYSQAADWWSLGVILFELIVGNTPFDDTSSQRIYSNILSRRIQWPSESAENKMSADARDLIDRLLCMSPVQRLGANGAEEVMNHPFFSKHNIPWDRLHTAGVASRPTLSTPYDTSYFDARNSIFAVANNALRVSDSDDVSSGMGSPSSIHVQPGTTLATLKLGEPNASAGSTDHPSFESLPRSSNSADELRQSHERTRDAETLRRCDVHCNITYVHFANLMQLNTQNLAHNNAKGTDEASLGNADVAGGRTG